MRGGVEDLPQKRPGAYIAMCMRKPQILKPSPQDRNPRSKGSLCILKLLRLSNQNLKQHSLLRPKSFRTFGARIKTKRRSETHPLGAA